LAPIPSRGLPEVIRFRAVAQIDLSTGTPCRKKIEAAARLTGDMAVIASRGNRRRRMGSSDMNEHPNTKLIRRGYQAFASGDLESLGELTDPGVVWHEPGRSPLGGDYAGRDGVLELLGKFGDLSDGTFSFDLVEVLATADRAVALHELTARRGDRVLDMASAVEFEIHGGRITEVTVYHDDTYSFDAFWS
jgi:uncharacterized protein